MVVEFVNIEAEIFLTSVLLLSLSQNAVVGVWSH